MMSCWKYRISQNILSLMAEEWMVVFDRNVLTWPMQGSSAQK